MKKLSDIVNALADSPSQANYATLLSELPKHPLGVKLVQAPDLKQGQQTSGAGTTIRCCEIKGQTFVHAFADVHDWRKASPEEAWAEMSALDVLRMGTADHVHGVLISALPKDAWICVRKSDIPPLINSASVVVPEGDKVVTFKATAKSGLQQSQTGALIACLGPDGYEVILSKVESVLASQRAVIWMIEGPTAEAWIADPFTVSDYLRALFKLKHVCPASTAVVSSDAPAARALRTLLASLGLVVFEAAPDGTAFVEVHKPDGSITPGMPGKPFVPAKSMFESPNFLAQLYEKMEKARSKQSSELQKLEKEEVNFIARTAKNAEK